MLRVRFHGRGGHGVKTASRILGTAAFTSGFQAQDFPLYGAERRGAPVTAYTRIDREPIHERGIIRDPDLILVADETLLNDPNSGTLLGADAAAAVLVNSRLRNSVIAEQLMLPCPIGTLDLSGMTGELLGRHAPVSSALGGVACALTGLISQERLAGAVQAELEDLRLSPKTIAQNIALARQAFAAIAAALPRAITKTPAPVAMHPPAYVSGPTGIPVIVAAGNSIARHTGNWRTLRPIIDLHACTRCLVCLLRCPDAAIALDGRGYPTIDYDNCKGCMICAQECPLRCILEEREVRT